MFDRDNVITRGIRVIPFGELPPELLLAKPATKSCISALMAVFAALFLSIFQTTGVIAIALFMTFASVVLTGGSLLSDVLLFIKVQSRAKQMGSGITAAPGIGESCLIRLPSNPVSDLVSQACISRPHRRPYSFLPS